MRTETIGEATLFGEELTEQPAPKSPKKTGHAWTPGTGPKGETCQSCAHYVRRQWDKVYLKCGLMREHWTQGPGTDIRARDAACKKWEPAP